MELEFLKNVLKIDDTEEDVYLENLIEVSDIYITSMVGETFKEDAKLVKLSELLQQKLINDMRENRGTEVPGNTKTDRIVLSILDKLANYESEII